MKVAVGVTSLVAVLLSAGLPDAAPRTSPAAAEFVGTSPCGALPRVFLGGIAPAAACDAITWRLTLVMTGAVPSTWKLAAGYEIPAPGNPGHLVDGPRVALEGTWDTAKGTRSSPTVTTYRLKTGRPERTLHLALVGHDLLQLLAEDKSLLVGNSGWSYTLNRADRVENALSDAPAPDLSYAISPRATGPVFGVFEGRTPCRGIARALNRQEIPGCIKVKWRITLNQDPQSSAPTTYKVEGSLHRKRAREGTWTVVRGAAGPESVVYRLGATQSEAALLLMEGDDSVVFFLDEQQRLLVGNGEFSYTLNRIPGH